MDETRIPDGVERIVLLGAEPRLLFKRKKTSSSAKDSRFRKSLQKAVVAVADAQRDGAAAAVDKLPRPSGGSSFGPMAKVLKKVRRRGMKLLRMK